MSWRFQDKTKLFKSVDGRKKNRGKNNPVCSMNYKIKQMHAVLLPWISHLVIAGMR